MEGGPVRDFDESELRELEHNSKDYVVFHGILARTAQRPESNDVVCHHAVTMLPSPIPTHIYHQACDVQKDYNLLMHRVTKDKEFLYTCLKSAIQVDEFTRKMWNILETVTTEGPSQNISLEMYRSDYMMDCGIPYEEVEKYNKKIDPSKVNLRQIEFNTIAAGLAGISAQLSGFHRYILDCLGKKNFDDKLPENRGGEGQAEAVAEAFRQYGNPEAAVLFLVLPVERNIYDHRCLEYGVQKQIRGLKVIRRTMEQLTDRMILTEDKRMVIDNVEIAVVYFRTCYTPQQFASNQDWETRLQIERSRAVKCPSIASQLAGTKKVQQVLAAPGMVERFISDPDAVTRLRNTFAGQYTLDLNEEGNAAAAMAIADPHKFVMKPQLEGGGNNIFGEDIKTLLQELGESPERTKYILMEKIYPTPIYNYPLKVDVPTSKQLMVSEVGIFGNLVSNGNDIVYNEMKGHMLRTKNCGVNEGGVATGFAFIDTAYLI